MKKALLVLFVFTGWFLQAQNLQLVKATDTVWMPAHSVPAEDPSGYATVENTGTSDLDVWCKRVELSIDISDVNYFCWKDCYTPPVTVSPDPVTINANTRDSSFVGYSRPKGDGVLGCDSIRYVLWDGNNPNDSVSFVMYYCTGALVSVDKYVSNYSFEAYPNPAKDQLNVRHNLRGVQKAELVITNMIGAMVYIGDVDTRTDVTQIDLSSFRPGVYFYSLQVENQKIGTKRFVIAR